MPQKKRKPIETLKVNTMATNEPPEWLQTFLQAQQEQMAQFQQAIVAATSHYNTQVQEGNLENVTNTSQSLRAARPEKLDVDISYGKFISWRQSWKDYCKIQKLDFQTLDIQQADFRCCLSEEVKIHLKCAIDVSHFDNSTVEEILDKIQQY